MVKCCWKKKKEEKKSLYVSNVTDMTFATLNNEANMHELL